MNSNDSLYDKSFESDACGIGCVANIDGIKTNQIISEALSMLENMSHRGATGNNKKIGDGAGIKTKKIYYYLVQENMHWECFFFQTILRNTILLRIF